MSKLKAFNSERIYWAVEQVERVAGDIDELHLDDTLFYLKSKVDKVIEEKDLEIVELKNQIHDYVQGLYVIQSSEEKEARRQKYKRCLGIIYNIKAAQRRAFFVSDEYLEWLTKWLERWLKISEKFKEAESGNSKRED